MHPKVPVQPYSPVARFVDKEVDVLDLIWMFQDQSEEMVRVLRLNYLRIEHFTRFIVAGGFASSYVNGEASPERGLLPLDDVSAILHSDVEQRAPIISFV